VKTLGVVSILSVLSLGLVLEGCKDAASSAEPAAAPAPVTVTTQPAAPDVPPTPPHDRRPVIVCFGDSLTAGYGTDPGQSYPDALQRLLDSRGSYYRVVNEGISGNTTKDGLDRVGDVIAEHPKIVVLEFGGNDGLRGLPLEQTRSNLDSMVAQLKSSGTQVALAGITLPPDYGHDYIAQFNAMYTSLARKYRVPLLPFLLQGVFGVPGDMQDDATHATAKGNQQVAKNVERLIQPMLRR
jgi:acyl-CoA thioesterase-1